MKNIILSLAGTYFIFAFTLWDLEASNWEVIHRTLTVLLGAFIGCYLEINDDIDDKHDTI